MGESSNTVPTLSENFCFGWFAIAAIDLGLFKISDFVGIAMRAAHFAVRPANRYHELTAVLEVAEELDGLLKGLRRFMMFQSSQKS